MRSFEEIAQELNMSTDIARNTYSRAIRKLGSPQNRKRFREILETLELLEQLRAKEEAFSLESLIFHQK